MKNFDPKVEMWDIKKILPYPMNAKKHPDEQIAKLAAAMVEFGMDVPVVVDGDGVLIKGHGRRLAAIKLGLKQFPVIVRTDLTPTQVKAARLADNRISQTGWDDEILSLEMTELFDDGFDLTLVGFDPEETAKMFGIELDENATTDEPPKDNYSQQYGVIVMCDSEPHQEDVYNKLAEMGYSVKVVVT